MALATDKQKLFIRALLAERKGITKAEHVRDQLNAIREVQPITREQASQAIATLLEVKPNELEDGIYRRADGSIVKVYHTIHGSNTQVGKNLRITDNGDGTFNGEFEYVGKAALKGLTPAMRMTEAEAKEFGQVYGFCVFGHPLTREESLYVGYGKTCAANNGWWYPTKAELKALSAEAVSA